MFQSASNTKQTTNEWHQGSKFHNRNTSSDILTNLSRSWVVTYAGIKQRYTSSDFIFKIILSHLKTKCITIIDESFRLGNSNFVLFKVNSVSTQLLRISFHSSCTRLYDNSVNESNLKRSMSSFYSGHQSNPI